MVWNWKHSEWPKFAFDLEKVLPKLEAFEASTAFYVGAAAAVPEESRLEAALDLLIAEAMKTSEVEGELLSRQDIKSSIQNNLNRLPKQKVKDARAKGVGKLLVAVRQTYDKPLSKAMLCNWHELLLHHETSLVVGKYRNHQDPLQVVSGAFGKTMVHFEAPPSAMVEEEMLHFVRWFNAFEVAGLSRVQQAGLKASLSHLYFESVHPFEDGNGRLGRAVAEKALLQGMGSPLPISLSSIIEPERKAYYQALQHAQQRMDANDWLVYFLGVLNDALGFAHKTVKFTVHKAHLLAKYSPQMNERQLKVVKRMLDEGPLGFKGGMNARKYMHLTSASKATATRDLKALLEMGVFSVLGDGRSTRYQLAMYPENGSEPDMLQEMLAAYG